MFQFPSNGKVDSKLRGLTMAIPVQPIVSIPFKRESGFKVWDLKVLNNTKLFQFPSNGKVDSKETNFFDDRNHILFQFPSNGKVDSKSCPARWEQRSPQQEFQFPSNGKVDSKKLVMSFHFASGLKFQFPSNGKVDSKMIKEWYKKRGLRFQFPSNGKVDSKQQT